jgi:hypothetical protein
MHYFDATHTDADRSDRILDHGTAARMQSNAFIPARVAFTLRRMGTRRSKGGVPRLDSSSCLFGQEMRQHVPGAREFCPVIMNKARCSRVMW